VHFLKNGIVACCVLLLTACQAIRDETDPNTVGVRGVRPTLEQLNVSSTTAAQTIFVNDLIVKAGFADRDGRAMYMEPRNNPDWRIVTEAGIYEIGRQCDQYLDVLFHFNRGQRAIRQGLTATGAATATILGLASAAAAPIAIVAAAFGLSASLFDAGVNSVLFTIEPSALRNIALKGRQGYLERLKMGDINNRPRMLIALQGYLAQCSPAAIEANVNNAASGAPSVASTDPDVSERAAGLAAPGATALLGVKPTRGEVATTSRQLTQPELAGGGGQGEEAVRRRELATAQAALGVRATGEFGPATRQAITEFQRGASRQGIGGWTANDVTGTFTGKTRTVLGNMSAMPPIFQSPFERGLFGNAEAQSMSQLYTRPQPAIVNGFLLRFAPPLEGLPTGDTTGVLSDKLELMRKRLGSPLTSQLYQKVLDSSADTFGPREN
jgi:hypothetical protein